MAYVAQMLMQEPIYKPSSIFCLKPILLSTHKLILLIYGDNTLVKESTLKLVLPLRTAPLGTLNLKSNLAPYSLLICSGTYP